MLWKNCEEAFKPAEKFDLVPPYVSLLYWIWARRGGVSSPPTSRLPRLALPN